MPDTVVFDILRDITTKCYMFLHYIKVEPKPIVGFPLSSQFNETVVPWRI